MLRPQLCTIPCSALFGYKSYHFHNVCVPMILVNTYAVHYACLFYLITTDMFSFVNLFPFSN